MDAHDALHELDAKIAEWEADNVFPGDRGYQDMLERRAELQEAADKETEELWERLNKQ